MRPGGSGRLSPGGRGLAPVGGREKHGPVVAAARSPGGRPGCARSGRRAVVHAGTADEGPSGPGTGISARSVAVRNRAAGWGGRAPVQGAAPVGRQRVRPGRGQPSAAVGLCRPERVARQVGSRSVPRPGAVRLAGQELTIISHERRVTGLMACRPVTVRTTASVTVPETAGARRAVTGGAGAAVPGRATGRCRACAPPETAVRRHTHRR